MTTTNKPMTGEQLDELMTIAVNMQRDSEKIGERSVAMFAYAVQVAVLEIRDVRSQLAESQSKLEKMAAENAALKKYICDECYVENIKTGAAKCAGLGMPVTPATDAILAEVRAQVWIEAKDFTKSMLACDSVDHLDFLFDGKVQQLRQGGAV